MSVIEETVPGQDRLRAVLAGCTDPVQEVTHPPVHTVEEAMPYWAQLSGEHTKNLLLKDNRGQLWLVTMRAGLRADLKALAGLLGAKRVSFASPATLLAALGLAPGAVSPLGLVNDATGQVRLALDRALLEAGRITCHPLVNTATVSLSSQDFARVLERLGVRPLVLDLDPAST
ncbi:Prolyl-tRNA synthetase associated domain-containing protein [Rhodovastum atsumiense]|uniref:Prolyl-tRNA synthetase associated domain-containing protein n=1 Tax=Rhodovastum atsumiense TaxID=504468 RepID=A0A5M6J0K1_9PROT|nr:prolyl-tRNA synthetase associated domain-containing protein [Rhodovastum atsumiense]KAA5614112.1 prolyl-tRNA synthetase associated domain-containing protein [Rhodovastum atsumiense]CAH2598956.1 Prolyl-tRNA synthetase associated domain-containing protein [Rhodovastum atsumiense]